MRHGGCCCEVQGVELPSMGSSYPASSTNLLRILERVKGGANDQGTKTVDIVGETSASSFSSPASLVFHWQ